MSAKTLRASELVVNPAAATASGMTGMGVILTPALAPGQAVIHQRNRIRTLLIGEPSAIRTQVWDDLHRRLPWLRGGDDPLVRLLAGVKALP